jgi:hypothetical protein
MKKRCDSALCPLCAPVHAALDAILARLAAQAATPPVPAPVTR